MIGSTGRFVNIPYCNTRACSAKLQCWRRPFALLCVGIAITALFSIYSGGVGHNGSTAVNYSGRYSSTTLSKGFKYEKGEEGYSGGSIQSIWYSYGGADCGQSKHRKRYRSLICTISRNDLHLREFLVRHLLLGFCHVVVYDNNRVLQGQDHNITDLLEPFVRAGLVTHIPYFQNHTGLLPEPLKNEHVFDCIRRFGQHVDWMASLDTDEYLFIQEQPDGAVATAHSMHLMGGSQQKATSVGILNRFLTDVEQQTDLNSTCALSFPWRMMYGEHRVLKDSKLLMEAYPRVCITHRLSKLIFRPGEAVLDPPHDADCSGGADLDLGVRHITDDESDWPEAASRKVSVDDQVFRDVLPQYQVHLLHYYTRSVEEFVMKSEQSIPPWYRLVNTSYDIARHCKLRRIAYDSEYAAAVRNSMETLRDMQRHKESLCMDLGDVAQTACWSDTSSGSDHHDHDDGGLVLSRPVELRPLSRPDYALYLFMKLRVQQQHEWDEDMYLDKNPEVTKLVQQHKFVDGLHHFVVVGFRLGKISCWSTAQNDTLCI